MLPSNHRRQTLNSSELHFYVLNVGKNRADIIVITNSAHNKHFHKYLKIDINKENDYLTCLNGKWKQPNGNIVLHILDESFCVIIWDKVPRDPMVRPVFPHQISHKTQQ